MSPTSNLKTITMDNNLNNNIEGQLANQLQKLVVEINELEDKLAKVSKAKERKKLQKQLDDKMALYKSLTEASQAPEETSDKAPEATEEIPQADEAPKATEATEEAPEEQTPQEAPKAPEATEAPKVKAPKAKATEAPKVNTPKTQTPAPKVTAKDIPTMKLEDIVQDDKGKPTKLFSAIVYAVLTVVLGFVAWWYLYTDTSTVAGAVVYERATAELKEDIRPKWYRWHSWDLKVKCEAIVKWMPAYKLAFVDSGLTSTKGEATLYAVGCTIRALTKKGLTIGEAAEQIDAMSFEQFKAALDADATLTAEEARAIKRALDR